MQINKSKISERLCHLLPEEKIDSIVDLLYKKCNKDIVKVCYMINLSL